MESLYRSSVLGFFVLSQSFERVPELSDRRCLETLPVISLCHYSYFNSNAVANTNDYTINNANDYTINNANANANAITNAIANAITNAIANANAITNANANETLCIMLQIRRGNDCIRRLYTRELLVCIRHLYG
jgi:hypothetical protein